MIAIIDYGVGNVTSIKNMLRKSGFNAILTNNHEEIRAAEKIILPGIGAFDSCAENLTSYNLRDILTERAIEAHIPFLGICVGMQLLAENSEEGILPGLGFIPSKVKRFSFKDSNLKIPHMGWNTIHPKEDNPLFKDLPDDFRFYFAHSYHIACDNDSNIGATTQYGYNFAASVRKDNIYGVQFHPEKSLKFGMKVLANFASI
jgi:imidazole glycerol-phosphate synthase subunit HisH